MPARRPPDLARLEADGRFETLVDRFEGKRFNSPNDLVIAKDGAIYFTDPPYGLAKTFDDPGREIGWNGVYRLAPDGRVTVLVKDLKAPNGIGLSPDGRTLYVGQSDGERPVVMAYDLQADGTVANGRVLFDTKPLRDARTRRAGRPEGRRAGQRVHDGTGRRAGAHAEGRASRHDRHRRADGELRLRRRRRRNALPDRERQAVPDPHEDEGPGLLAMATHAIAGDGAAAGGPSEEYEREPVPRRALLGFGSFIGQYAGEHTAGTELMIGPLFVAAGVSAFDLLVGLLLGNLLAVLSWTLLHGADRDARAADALLPAGEDLRPQPGHARTTWPTA